jgi:hypothetical protein
MAALVAAGDVEGAKLASDMLARLLGTVGPPDGPPRGVLSLDDERRKRGR